MSQTHLNEIAAHLVVRNKLGELLVQRGFAFGCEGLLSIVLHDFEAGLEDLLPVNS